MAVNHRVCVMLVTTATALGVLAGCTAPSQTPTATPTSPATATPTPSPLSPAERDLENAKGAVMKLWATYDRIATDPEASIGDMIAVAGSPLLDTLQSNLSRYRSYELKGSGETAVQELSARLIGVNEQGLTTWAVTACLDSTNFDLVDQSGKSVLGPPYRVRHDSTVVLRDGNLLVVEDDANGTC